jgi:glycosyltransferase involved in cell wall biosynthesis
MTKKSITFIGANHAVTPLLNALSETHTVSAYNSAPLGSLTSEATLTVLTPAPLFIETILKKYNKETSPPFYLQGLLPALWKEKPSTVIVMDIIRLWSVQAYVYTLFHKHVHISVLSETKRVPTSLFSKVFFYCMFFIFKLMMFRIQKIFVYEKIGYSFFKNRGFENVEIIKLPIEENVFYPSTGKKYKEGGILKLIMVARYATYKRHIDLLSALRKALNSGITNIHLTLIGSSGNNESKIRTYIQEHDLEHIVTILPPIPKEHIRELYYSHDVLVLPSEYEAIGMVVPEAMACGLATITSDTVGANIYVEKDTTGLIFETGNIELLCQKITTYAKTDLAEKHGQEGSRRMREMFSERNCAELFTKLAK